MSDGTNPHHESGLDERTPFLRVTTFRRSGDPVSTPVWVARLPDGGYGFYTGSATGKVKRLRHTPRAEVQACSARGTPREGTSPVAVECELVNGDDLAAIDTAIRRKYGRLQVGAADVGARVMAWVQARRRGRPQDASRAHDVGVRFRLPNSGAREGGPR